MRSLQQALSTSHRPPSTVHRRAGTLPLPHSATIETAAGSFWLLLLAAGCWLLTGAAINLITPHTLALTLPCGCIQAVLWGWANAASAANRLMSDDDDSIHGHPSDLAQPPYSSFRPLPHAVLAHAPCPMPCCPCTVLRPAPRP